jgi:diacylglycerol kinase family enzyme
MYAYIVDSWLQDKKYQAELFRIESRLGQLGIRGRMEKITILKNLLDAARDAVRRGATTLVAIGNDETIIKLLPVAIEANVTLGLIPMGQPQSVAQAFGIPSGVAACDALSRRVVRHIDVGKADSQYFLLEARLTTNGPVECDGKYTVESLDPNGQVIFGNIGGAETTGQASDGRLQLIVQPASRGFWQRSFSHASVFPIKTATLPSSSHTSLLLDGQVVMKSPTTIAVASKKLGVIVGRERRLAP